MDPEAELVATLAAFLAPVVSGLEDEHALCRFPARRAWLESRLDLTRRGISIRCPALDDALGRVDATGVSLVYASTYLGNPASAFGHTFLHVRTGHGETSPRDQATRDREDLGVEFRAVTDTKNPLLYAVKGISGLFPGRVESKPYDEQAHLYTTGQGRDLWEYELALTHDELTLLLLHLWELRHARIDYYYLTRNCSFEVLELLETAAPRLDLVDGLHAFVLPIDTIRAVTRVPGLVRRVAYRPSLETRLHRRIGVLSNLEELQVRRLLHDAAAPFSPEMADDRRARVLDAAIFEIETKSSKDLEGALPTRAKQLWQALVTRRGPDALPEPRTLPDWDARPDIAHGAMRVALGTGVTSQYGDAFGTFGYRLALHDLTDPPDGSPELSQVVILDTKFRYTWARRELTLDNLTFADLEALNPVSVADPLASFRVRAFGLRLHDRDCLDCFAHGVDGSIGATVASHDQRFAFFVMADAYVAFLPHLSGFEGSFLRLGTGPYGGIRARLGETVALLTGTVSYLPGEHLDATYDVHFSAKSTRGARVALGVELDAQPLSVEGQLASYVYF
jgi:hypothetical protein